MPAIKNLVAKKYNKLTVIERAENLNGRVAWKCLCDCGRTSIIRTGDLTTGSTKSCGNCENVYENTMFEFYNGYVIGHSKNGRNFFIDEEDLFKIKDFNITVNPKGYVTLSKEAIEYPLHRFLMNPTEDEVVDHINRIPNDNRKINLRVCFQYENTWNSSLTKRNKTGVKGVYFCKNDKKFRVEITVKGKKHYLGLFKNFDDAVQVRKEAEKKYFGEYVPKKVN